MAIITEIEGDIFSAPPNSVLIHACNCHGSWGAGVAKAFKMHYPQAYRLHQNYCRNHSPPSSQPHSKNLANIHHPLEGTCQLIPPIASSKSTFSTHWIACLFTSIGYGKNTASKEVILENTRQAMADLARQLAEVRVKREKGQEDGPGEFWAVRINSGLFGVPWDETKAVLEDWEVDILVVRPPAVAAARKGKVGEVRMEEADEEEEVVK